MLSQLGLLNRRQQNRRQLLKTGLSASAVLGVNSLLPAWAQPARAGNLGIPSLLGTTFDLRVHKFPVRIDGRDSHAVGVNGTVPAPLIRFREGDDVQLNVTNDLDEDTSIHWHGLLVPFHMDGVPGVSFPGIKPGETFPYRFSVPQNGTYWYHSHSGLQEQMGHYGPLIIDPAGVDPVRYDREYVLVLSDWSFMHPHRIFAMLKKDAESLNYNRPTLQEPAGLGGMWGEMRMSPRDIADVTGETFTYVVNGHATSDNFDMRFSPGERVRLRIINASAMTLFNIRIPGLPMTIVNADGLNTQPLAIDEFQMGVAETYDVIVEPHEDRPYAFVAESIDRSGQVVATLAPRDDLRAEVPELRTAPMLAMRDMGMDHGGMTGSETDHSMMGHSAMDHGAMDHGAMDHGNTPSKLEATVERGPGVANIAAMPASRLDEPGIGLENMPHRTLRYSQLRALTPNPDKRAPEREVVVHLTSNMERYMWSFDGVKFSEVTEAIKFYEGERVRLTLVNNTMMPHPIHLHGMFFDLVVPGSGESGNQQRVRKHTVVVKPAEKLSVDISADHIGDWAFHCHLLYHMHAGMMQVVSVLPKTLSDQPDVPPASHSEMNHGEMDHGSGHHTGHGMPNQEDSQ